MPAPTLARLLPRQAERRARTRPALSKEPRAGGPPPQAGPLCQSPAGGSAVGSPWRGAAAARARLLRPGRGSAPNACAGPAGRGREGLGSDPAALRHCRRLGAGRGRPGGRAAEVGASGRGLLGLPLAALHALAGGGGSGAQAWHSSRPRQRQEGLDQARLRGSFGVGWGLCCPAGSPAPEGCRRGPAGAGGRGEVGRSGAVLSPPGRGCRLAPEPRACGAGLTRPLPAPAGAKGRAGQPGKEALGHPGLVALPHRGPFRLLSSPPFSATCSCKG